MMVNLKPRRQREATVTDIVNRLRPKLSNFPGCACSSRFRRRSASAAACPRAATISRCTGRTPQQLYAEAPKLERVDRAHARPAGCLERPADQERRA